MTCKNITCLLIVLSFIQCAEREADKGANRSKYRKGTIVYYDEPGYSVLIPFQEDTTRLLKRTIWEGFPEEIDTLIKDETGMWWSRQYTTHYQITDSSVNWWFDLKVVHPSSNWQGQTPGVQRQPFTGKRY
jgi:hypothetical protein